MPPTRSRRNGATNTRATSTPAGISCGSTPSRARSGSASSPPTLSSPRATTPFPASNRAPNARSTRDRWRSMPATRRETDHEIGRMVEAIDDLGRQGQHARSFYYFRDNGASMEGTGERHLQREWSFSTAYRSRPGPAARGGMKAYGGPSKYGAAEDRAALCGRLGLGGQHALSMGQAGRLPSRRDPQPHGRALAEEKEREWRASQPLPMHRHRHRSDPARGRRRAGAQDRRRHAAVGPRCSGVSLPARRLPTRQAPSRRPTQQYFEVLGNRAMYKDGWWLACRLPRIPWKVDPTTLARFAPGRWDPDTDC